MDPFGDFVGCDAIGCGAIALDRAPRIRFGTFTEEEVAAFYVAVPEPPVVLPPHLPRAPVVAAHLLPAAGAAHRFVFGPDDDVISPSPEDERRALFMTFGPDHADPITHEEIRDVLNRDLVGLGYVVRTVALFHGGDGRPVHGHIIFSADVVEEFLSRGWLVVDGRRRRCRKSEFMINNKTIWACRYTSARHLR